RSTVRLQHAEPLHGGTQVLTLLPPSGPAGPVRVLVSPEAQLADGLLTSNPMDGKPLQHATVGDDGVSGILPSPPGVPTCSRVVLLGLDSGYPGASGARVLYSGIMTAEMLAGMPDKVEVGSPALAPDRDALPETQWFADGAKLAAKVPGKGTLTVAALGPRLAARPLDSADKRMVSSRAYELRRGGSTWVGSVVDVAGKTVCASAMPAGSAPEPTAWALRCPIPGDMMPGIVHVVGAPEAQSVEVALQPTASPAGQERFAGTAHRADDQPVDQAFAAIQVAPMGFPCGVGTLRVHSGRAVTGVSLPVYTPGPDKFPSSGPSGPSWRVMRQKLAIAPALVAALPLGALTVHTPASPAGAAAAPATWDLEAYGPKTGDDVVLKWNEQLLATIRANPAATGPTVTSRALGVLQTSVF